MTNEHYRDFIKEAFIDPIRSVLIVDDDYPTIEEILKSSVDEEGRLEIADGKSWPNNQKRISKMIQTFRSPEKPLLVDIHDGRNVTFGKETKAAAHLHQSDFLVLDFELEKSSPRDGARAIKILRQVMGNNHFNLVVIHTTEELDYVFYSVLKGLVGRSGLALSDDQGNQVVELIEKQEDLEEGFSEHLFGSVSEQQYFYSRQNPQAYYQAMYEGKQPYSSFKKLCDDAGWKGQTPKLVLSYLLIEAEQKLDLGQRARGPINLEWSDNAVRWMRSDSVFVAFSHKPKEEELLDAVLNALDDWAPEPPRLFLAKIRSVMDEYGVLAQGQALAHKYALAYWYNRLLDADKSRQSLLISESVSRHSDQLMGSILEQVERFVSRLVEAELEHDNPTQICEDRFQINLNDPSAKKRAEREHNAIVCSMPPEGWHLTTGHVLLLNGEYWVCLSPICDLVPHQMSESSIRVFGERMPFTAVKLRPIPDDQNVNGVQTNRFIFLQVESTVKAFGFNNPEFEDSSPFWQTLFAEKRGVFSSGKFDFKVSRTKEGSRKLISNVSEVKVVAQLRYEYALNLVQKLGVSMTRIGLDFTGSN